MALFHHDTSLSGRAWRLAPWLLPGTLAGCSGPAPQAVAPAPAAAASYLAPPPCRTGEDCLVKGVAALGDGQADARVLLTLACNKHNAEGCLELGKALATGKGGAVDRETARKAFERICHDPSTERWKAECRAAADVGPMSTTTCVVDACAWLVELAAGEASEREVYAERGCSLEGQRGAENTALRGRACMIAAKHREAGGQTDKARESYEAACFLGSGDGCKVAFALAASAPPPAPGPRPGTFSSPLHEIDGLVMRDLTCEVSSNPLFGILGGMLVGAGFARQKAALRQCSAQPFESKIYWVEDRPLVIALTAEVSDPAIKACVERVLLGVPAVGEGRCSATLVVDQAPAPAPAP